MKRRETRRIGEGIWAMIRIVGYTVATSTRIATMDCFEDGKRGQERQRERGLKRRGS